MWAWWVFRMPANQPCLSVMTAATPKIADYAFTTLTAATGYGGIPGWKKFLYCRSARYH